GTRGAGERNRTSTTFRAPDPKPGASAVPPRRHQARVMVSKVLDRPRLDGVRRLEAEDARVKVKLRVDRAPDVGRAPESVLLAFERDVGMRKLLRLAGGHELLRLVGRHDLVVEALGKDDRAAEVV